MKIKSCFLQLCRWLQLVFTIPSSITHSIFLLPLASKHLIHSFLPGSMTQSFIPEESVPLAVLLLWIYRSQSFANFYYKMWNTKRHPILSLGFQASPFCPHVIATQYSHDNQDPSRQSVNPLLFLFCIMQSPKWPGGSFCFRISGTIVVFKTSKSKVFGMAGKNFASSSVGIIVRGTTTLSSFDSQESCVSWLWRNSIIDSEHFPILEVITLALQSVAGTIIVFLSDQLRQGDSIHGNPSECYKQEFIPSFHPLRLLNEQLNQRKEIVWGVSCWQIQHKDQG